MTFVMFYPIKKIQGIITALTLNPFIFLYILSILNNPTTVNLSHPPNAKSVLPLITIRENKLIYSLKTMFIMLF